MWKWVNLKVKDKRYLSPKLLRGKSRKQDGNLKKDKLNEDMNLSWGISVGKPLKI